MVSTNLTREGKGRRRAEGEATHNIEILSHWRRRDRRGSLQSAMSEASEGGCIAMWGIGREENEKDKNKSCGPCPSYPHWPDRTVSTTGSAAS